MQATENYPRQYSWRRAVIATTPGNCPLCGGVRFHSGEIIVFLEFEPYGKKDYDRVHLECALALPDIDDRPDEQTLNQRIAELKVKQQELEVRLQNEVPKSTKTQKSIRAIFVATVFAVVKLPTPEHQLSKYAVTADGVMIHMTTNRTMAEGFAEGLKSPSYQQWLKERMEDLSI